MKTLPVRIKCFFVHGWWAFKNPKTLSSVNFNMLSELLGLILKVSTEQRHMMTHIAYIHPEEGETEIVSIWAGAGIGADPTKRIAELLTENRRLKLELSKCAEAPHPQTNQQK